MFNIWWTKIQNQLDGWRDFIDINSDNTKVSVDVINNNKF